jgi:hypothetical protein
MEKNCCPTNYKRLAMASVAVFLTLFATDYLIHGIMLKQLYADTAQLWRAQSEMEQYFPWMLCGQLVMAILFIKIFAHGYQNTGWKEGVRYGAMQSIFLTGNNLIMYAVTPWTITLLGAWAALGLLQSMLLGVVAACVYKA